jgi:TadE-like protein
MINLWHDKTGHMLVESAVVFPLFFALTLGTVDIGYFMFERALANKAAYMGARKAVVSNPVAATIADSSPSGDWINLYTQSQRNNIGAPCFNLSTGLQNGNCPSSGQIVCTSTACSPSTFGFDASAFTNVNGTGVFDSMQRIFPRLQPTNVTITYQTIDKDNSGFASAGVVLQPGGPPMTVTVRITGMTHQLFFMPSILRLFGGNIAAAWPIPASSTTMQSEDMFTN